MADKIGTDEYGEILIYQTDDGQTNIEVKIEDDTVWLTQQQLTELYQCSKSNISEHIKHIFEEGELDKDSVVRKFRTTSMQVEGYSLEAQKDKLRKYADYQEMSIVGEYSDEGKSGKSVEGRPQFKQMLADIESGKDNVDY